jgi:hypothetical protein
MRLPHLQVDLHKSETPFWAFLFEYNVHLLKRKPFCLNHDEVLVHSLSSTYERQTTDCADGVHAGDSPGLYPNYFGPELALKERHIQ